MSHLASTSDSSSVQKAAIFLAHSSQDFAQARLVRNLFEDEGHDVLLLKLSQQMERDFLETLLKREIEARGWLVIVRSAHARASQWVSFEREYGQSTGKPIYTIDLEACGGLAGPSLQDCLKSQVERVAKNFRVFLSYSRRDSVVADRVRDDLRARGYEVWIDRDEIGLGDDFVATLHGAIDETLARGALVLLMTSSALHSDFVRHELSYALSRHGRVVPCLVEGDGSAVPPELATIQWADFRRSYADGLTHLIAGLEHANAQRLSAGKGP